MSQIRGEDCAISRKSVFFGVFGIGIASHIVHSKFAQKTGHEGDIWSLTIAGLELVLVRN